MGQIACSAHCHRMCCGEMLRGGQSSVLLVKVAPASRAHLPRDTTDMDFMPSQWQSYNRRLWLSKVLMIGNQSQHVWNRAPTGASIERAMCVAGEILRNDHATTVLIRSSHPRLRSASVTRCCIYAGMRVWPPGRRVVALEIDTGRKLHILSTKNREQSSPNVLLTRGQHRCVAWLRRPEAVRQRVDANCSSWPVLRI